MENFVENWTINAWSTAGSPNGRKAWAEQSGLPMQDGAYSFRQEVYSLDEAIAVWDSVVEQCKKNKCSYYSVSLVHRVPNNHTDFQSFRCNSVRKHYRGK